MKHAIPVGNGIYAIDAHYLRPGLAASHLILENGRVAFVDTGTTYSVPYLLAALGELGLTVEQVDYVLLTHIHLDHAGGAGLLMSTLPNARAVIHPRGARHMVEPSKLIAGTVQVYGAQNFERLYGQIHPIAQERVLPSEDGMRIALAGRDLELIHTPGHALHHYCIVDRGAAAVFTGDNFGLSYREFDTTQGAFVFPTTTPVHFDPLAMHASLDRILGYRPQAAYLTHFSRVDEIERLGADLHECIDAFVAIARRNAASPERTLRIRAEMFDYLAARLDRHGFSAAPALTHRLLDGDVDLNTQGLEVWLDHAKV